MGERIIEDENSVDLTAVQWLAQECIEVWTDLAPRRESIGDMPYAATSAYYSKRRTTSLLGNAYIFRTSDRVIRGSREDPQTERIDSVDLLYMDDPSELVDYFESLKDPEKGVVHQPLFITRLVHRRKHKGDPKNPHGGNFHTEDEVANSKHFRNHNGEGFAEMVLTELVDLENSNQLVAVDPALLPAPRLTNRGW